MKRSFTNRTPHGVRLALTAACALTLAACAGQSARPPADTKPTQARLAPEEAASQRAIKRWDLLIERRFEEAYELLSPGYRQTMSKEAYVKTMKNRPVQWTRANFQKATCEPELCSVEIQVNAQFQMPVMRVGTIDAMNFVSENWILSDGQWYLVPAAEN
jgi:hypothetical protein